MTDAEPGADAPLFHKSAGEKLREAREAQGLALSEIAARTRVPIRHLEAIEAGDYTSLPSPTYAVGFAKAYARAVGADEAAIGREVRGAGAAPAAPGGGGAPRGITPAPLPRARHYETRDPHRLPPKGLATALALVAAILLGGIAIWYGTGWFRGDGTTVVAVPAPEPAPVARPTPAPAAPAGGGQVTLAATDLVWLRVYDASGATLYEHELQPGERYDVPPGADHPMINVGRPDKLAITVNGAAVPPLGDGSRAIKDVEISASALLARANPANGADGAAAPGTAPEARPRRAPRPRGSAETDRDATARANATAPAPAPPPAPAPAEGDAPRVP